MAPALVLVGGGKMGGALLDGWLAHGTPASDVTVVDPEESTAAALKTKGVNVVSSSGDLPPDLQPEVVVFAVKPQVMESVVPDYEGFTGPATLFMSIAAGLTIAFFENRLGAEAAVVRCMPNLPASIHRGVTGAVAGAKVSASQRARAQQLMEAVGALTWVEDEALIDVVTAVSGSGPAYVFLLAECMAQAGVDAGLPKDLAEKLARETVSGAGSLLDRSTESAETLRKNVTSPGGTTAAALDILMADDGLRGLMKRAVDRAAERSRELAVK